MMLGGRLLAVAGTVGIATAAVSSALVVDPLVNRAYEIDVNMSPTRRAPHAGLICTWAIAASMVEVGRQCGVQRNAAFETEVARTVSLIEDYVRQRSPEGVGNMADYRARHIDGDRRLCHADPITMYQQLSRADPQMIREDIDRFLATSPPVEWGDCL